VECSLTVDRHHRTPDDVTQDLPAPVIDVCGH